MLSENLGTLGGRSRVREFARASGSVSRVAGQRGTEPMSLLQRVERAQQAANTAANAPASHGAPAAPAPPPTALVPVLDPVRPSSRTPAREDLIREIRLILQTEVVGAFDSLLDAPPNEVRDQDRGRSSTGSSRKHSFAVTRDERARLSRRWSTTSRGFGPIEPLLHDETITEVMVNGPDHIYIERGGKIQRVDTTFLNDEHVLRVIDRIITPLGRRIDESSPRVDARLPDGSRVNAIIEPLSLIGPVITVRKFSTRPYTVDDLIRFGTATPEMFEFLRACIEARLNLFVSGGTGLRQDDDPQRAVGASSRTTSASSRSRTPPSCSSARTT